MTRYYKATTLAGTDFRTGTVLYESGRVTTHPVAKRVRNDPSTYLSVSTVPTDCTGMRWPCRLFAVEGVGRVMKNDDLPNKRCFSAVRVVEELPAHEVFGPQGEAVAALIARASRLTVVELERLAWASAWASARASAWDSAWDSAGDSAGAVADAAAALVVRDLICPEHFDILYGPWRKVIGDE